jgi:predicted RNase H-like nuclease
MKNALLGIVFLIIISCGVNKTTTTNALYEVLTEQKDGGASIEFYEILTEGNEIKMLLNDENLKNKIQEKDIETSNFVIINSGFKNEGNNKINIESITETPNKIIVKIKKDDKNKIVNIELGTVNPYLILKINSKKDIVFE